MSAEPAAANQLWPADQVERRPVAALVPYAQNARLHSDEQIEGLAASMREWGFTMPLLVDEAGEIIAGHGRLLAAARLGYESVPAMVARGWTAAQIKAYRLADNRLAELASWDLGLLAAELESLPGMESLIGFAEGELADMLGGDGGGKPLPSVGEARKTLAERFGLPPFSVLNAREGWWQARKRAWLALGIQSELGRGENLLQFSDTVLEPDPAKRARAKATAKSFETGVKHGDGRPGTSGDQMFAKPGRKRKGRFIGQDILNGEHAGITPERGLTTKGQAVRAEQGGIVAGKGWADGGPARRDAAFYKKKRDWEKEHGQQISTTEFREKYWDGRPQA